MRVSALQGLLISIIFKDNKFLEIFIKTSEL